MKRFTILLLLVLIAGAHAFTFASEAIMDDYANEKISLDEELTYLTYFLADTRLLPAEYAIYLDNGPMKSGTPIAHYIMENLPLASHDVRENILAIIAPSEVNGDDRASGYVESSSYPLRVYWNNSSWGSDSTAANATECVGYADDSWQVECTGSSRLWPPVPYNGLGQDYQFSLRDYGGALGVTFGTYYGQYYGHVAGKSYIYICIGNITDDEMFKSTVAHELAHGIQYAADWVETRFREPGAMYQEYVVYPAVDDAFQYFNSFQANPWLSLNHQSSPNLYQYGAWLWFFFLEDAYFNDNYWYCDMYKDGTQSGTTNNPHMLGTLDDMLETEFSDSVKDAFWEFCEWRLFAGSYQDSHHWSRAISPGVNRQVAHGASELPVVNQSVSSAQRPAKWGMNLIVFYNNSSPLPITVDFDGQDGIEWRAVLVGMDSSGTSDFYEYSLNGSNYGQVTIDDWSGYDRIALIVANFGDGAINASLGGWTNQASWTYSAWHSGSDIESIDLNGSAVEEGVLLDWQVTGDQPTEITVLRSIGDSTPVALHDAPLSGNATSFLDASVNDGEEYSYWLEVADADGVVNRFGPSEVIRYTDATPELSLSDPYPNPARGEIAISYDLPNDETVVLSVYDLSGRRIATVDAGMRTAGRHTVTWDASTVSSGVYLYRLSTDEESLTRRLVITR